ncbi:MAG: AAA family ATPase [Saprospiraceae bacterium]|nr:AAA family ATPase [Saprospiraceae bacterium]
MEQLIGRKEEIAVLENALKSTTAEMVSVIGRRRVGKTFLINQIYEKHIAFSISGTQNTPLKEQLGNFAYLLNEYANSTIAYKTPDSWQEAFQMLITYLKEKTVKSKEKIVVFFDELPWLATPRSGFLRSFSFFWNNWAVRQNIVVVICGSAASWMIQKVVHHRGGLYNRITQRIFLEPFDLSETELYLKSRNLHFEKYQIVQLYMAMGGIPHYLKEISKGKSATENINRICFSKGGLLRDEFLNLYPSLFANADRHIAIIRALAKKKQGLTRQQIVEATNVPEGGSIQRVLQELEQSGFIAVYRPYKRKKKEKLYRLIDEYSLFYLQFIESNEFEGGDTWNLLGQTPAIKAWSGYAYESICLKHLPQIKKALGIEGIQSTSASFFKKGTKTEKGTQIDLLLDRNDQVINLFEIKFSNQLFSISKAYFENLSDKVSIFRATTKTRKQLFLVFITTFGLTENQYSSGIVARSLTLDDLFREV